MILIKASSKQEDKFSHLQKTQYPTNRTDKKKAVNLSNKKLEPVVVPTLDKRLNSAHTTNPTLNIRYVISGI
jgi:hypothetical protein